MIVHIYTVAISLTVDIVPEKNVHKHNARAATSMPHNANEAAKTAAPKLE